MDPAEAIAQRQVCERARRVDNANALIDAEKREADLALRHQKEHQHSQQQAAMDWVPKRDDASTIRMWPRKKRPRPAAGADGADEETEEGDGDDDASLTTATSFLSRASTGRGSAPLRWDRAHVPDEADGDESSEGTPDYARARPATNDDAGRARRPLS